MSAPAADRREQVQQLLRELAQHKRAWDRFTLWEAEAKGFGDYLLARQIRKAADAHKAQFWLIADALGFAGLTADELTYRARALADAGE